MVRPRDDRSVPAEGRARSGARHLGRPHGARRRLHGSGTGRCRRAVVGAGPVAGCGRARRCGAGRRGGVGVEGTAPGHRASDAVPGERTGRHAARQVRVVAGRTKRRLHGIVGRRPVRAVGARLRNRPVTASHARRRGHRAHLLVARFERHRVRGRRHTATHRRRRHATAADCPDPGLPRCAMDDRRHDPVRPRPRRADEGPGIRRRSRRRDRARCRPRRNGPHRPPDALRRAAFPLHPCVTHPGTQRRVRRLARRRAGGTSHAPGVADPDGVAAVPIAEWGRAHAVRSRRHVDGPGARHDVDDTVGPGVRGCRARRPGAGVGRRRHRRVSRPRRAAGRRAHLVRTQRPPSWACVHDADPADRVSAGVP